MAAKLGRHPTYHVNTRPRAFGSGAEGARFAVSANGSAPGAAVFRGPGHTQGTVGVISV